MQFAAYSVEGSIKRFQQELESCIPQISDKLNSLQQQLQDPILYAAETALVDVQPILLGLGKQIHELKTEVDKCKRSENEKPK